MLKISRKTVRKFLETAPGWYAFGEFVPNQKLSTSIGVQERMFAYFGGVTPYVVVDNLKSGVHRAHLCDPDVNPTYCDFPNQMGFAVLPARPLKARDKAAEESNIGVIQRNFFQEVRNRTFYSLVELNAAFRNYLAWLNHAVMKDYDISHAQRFEQEKNPYDRFLPHASSSVIGAILRSTRIAMSRWTKTSTPFPLSTHAKGSGPA